MKLPTLQEAPRSPLPTLTRLRPSFRLSLMPRPSIRGASFTFQGCWLLPIIHRLYLSYFQTLLPKLQSKPRIDLISFIAHPQDLPAHKHKNGRQPRTSHHGGLPLCRPQDPPQCHSCRSNRHVGYVTHLNMVSHVYTTYGCCIWFLPVHYSRILSRTTSTCPDVMCLSQSLNGQSDDLIRLSPPRQEQKIDDDNRDRRERHTR